MKTKGFVWLPVVAIVVFVGLIIFTVKYITNPNVFFNVLKRANEGSEVSNTWAGIFGPLNFEYYSLSDDLGTDLIRTRINWKNVEPEKGNYVWDHEEIKIMDKYIALGKKVVPVIKIGGGKYYFWPVKSPLTYEDRDKILYDCSWMPKDIEDKFNSEYGYSKTYYDFISQVLNRYKGKLETVVIENEQDVFNFWCDGMNSVDAMKGYIKILETAKKAAIDIDPSIEVVDGGVCSRAIPYLIVKDYLDKGLDQKALDFWHGSMQHNKNLENTSLRVLKNFFKNNEYALKKIDRVNYLLDVLPDVSNTINFHYKEDVEYYPEIIKYIRERVGDDVKLMNNELGTKQKPAENIYDEAAKATVKFFVYSYILDVKPMIWYARDHGEYSAIGILNDEGIHKDWETYKALETIFKFLNKEFIRVQDISDDEFTRYLFMSKEDSIQVVWNKNNLNNSVNIPENCDAYSYLGEKIEGNKTTTLPLFIQCYNYELGNGYCRPGFSKCLDSHTMVDCEDNAKWGDPIECLQNEWCLASSGKCELMSRIISSPSPSFIPNNF